MRLRLAPSPTAWALVLTLAAGCGGAAEYAVVGTARSPGTDGTVRVESLEGGNQLVTISLTNVVPPDRLGQGITQYVAWFIGNNQPPVLAGRLAFDPDARTATLTATTPLRA
ncbi:MAG: hypothetical protein RMK74_13765, partial [Myxococcales bacterium]|nr:hypothetical protein [Myxococcales bacterium]